MASAVGQHKDATGLTKPGEFESGDAGLAGLSSYEHALTTPTARLASEEDTMLE